MSGIILLMFLLPLIGCLFAMTSPKNTFNAFNVALLTLVSNIALILFLFDYLNVLTLQTAQIAQTYEWLANFNLNLTFRVNATSLIILLGIYIALIIGLKGLSSDMRQNKSLILTSLYFIWTMNGFCIAGDIVTFYIFFSAMLLPLFMMLGLFGYAKKSLPLFRFFMYNFLGIICLFVAMVLLCRHYNGNILLKNIAFVDMDKPLGIIVWMLVCLAFISRIPVWPFHYWISSVVSKIKNPLVYITVNLLPLTGLYGFVRFWPLSVPESVELLVPIIEVFSIVTMIFIALIGLVNKEFLFKLFSYNTIYYLLFLLAVILPTDTLKMNIAYSLFIFMIVNASLVVLELQMEEKCSQIGNYHPAIFAYTPRFTLVLSFFVLIAVGLPVSSFFWSNFVLISAIFKQSFTVGVFVMIAISMVAVVLINTLYDLRRRGTLNDTYMKITDISNKETLFWLSVVCILMLSFFNPLWFVL